MKKILLICFSFMLLMCYSKMVMANNWSLKVEPGMAVPLDNPQSQLFNVGGDAMIKALFGVGSYVDVGPTIGFVGLSPSMRNTLSKDMGIGWQFGGGLRVKRPHNVRVKSAVDAVSPWADVDLMYVRTGPLNRLGFAIGTGLAFPLDQNRKVWFGPFVRYTQILQSDDNKMYDNHDAKILVVGLSLEFGNSHIPRKHVKVTHVCPTCPEPPKVEPCPLPPKVDPPTPRVVPQLIDKVQFGWDSDVLTEEGLLVIDKVKTILDNNEDYDVSIEGHASSEGQFKHNKNLSERRAKVVLEHLVDRGILRSRLSAKWFGSAVPIESNDTLKGRVANRRVTFKLEVISVQGGVN